MFVLNRKSNVLVQRRASPRNAARLKISVMTICLNLLWAFHLQHQSFKKFLAAFVSLNILLFSLPSSNSDPKSEGISRGVLFSITI